MQVQLCMAIIIAFACTVFGETASAQSDRSVEQLRQALDGQPTDSGFEAARRELLPLWRALFEVECKNSGGRTVSDSQKSLCSQTSSPIVALQEFQNAESYTGRLTIRLTDKSYTDSLKVLASRMIERTCGNQGGRHKKRDVVQDDEYTQTRFACESPQGNSTYFLAMILEDRTLAVFRMIGLVVLR